MGRTDTGSFLSHAVLGGVLGGLVAALWVAIAGAFHGLRWWSPLALYRTRLWGLARHPIVASSTHAAVLAGVTWLLGVGLAGGALFGLLGGALLPARSGRTALVLSGGLLGIIVYLISGADRLILLGPAIAADLPSWVRAVALGLVGATSGWCAASPGAAEGPRP